MVQDRGEEIKGLSQGGTMIMGLNLDEPQLYREKAEIVISGPDQIKAID
jgi:hypothetical protein